MLRFRKEVATKMPLFIHSDINEISNDYAISNCLKIHLIHHHAGAKPLHRNTSAEKNLQEPLCRIWFASRMALSRNKKSQDIQDGSTYRQIIHDAVVCLTAGSFCPAAPCGSASCQHEHLTSSQHLVHNSRTDIRFTHATQYGRNLTMPSDYVQQRNLLQHLFTVNGIFCMIGLAPTQKYGQKNAETTKGQKLTLHSSCSHPLLGVDKFSPTSKPKHARSDLTISKKKRAAMCCLFPLLTSFHVAFWSAPSMQSTRLLDGTRQGVVVLSDKLDRSWCWHLLSLHRTCRFQNEYSKMKQVITESNRIWLHFLNNSIEAYLQIQLCIY